MSELDDLRAMLRDLFDGNTETAALWEAAAELDLLGLLVPEEFGGAGAGLAEMSVVLQELGRKAVPLPMISSAVLAPIALLGGSNDELAKDMLPKLATGERRACVIAGGPEGQPAPANWALNSTPSRGGYALDGLAGYVLDAPGADDLIVCANGEDGLLVAAVDAGAANVDELATTDLTRRLATVTFNSVEVPASRVIATGDAAADLVARIHTVGSFAIACDAAGVSEIAMEKTAAYAQVRQQFGRAIGSFQAIKHKCADMAVAVEGNNAGLGLALAALTADSPDNIVASVSTAKAFICDAAVKVCTDAIQAHGGIGFTWEHDAHLWLKRALLDRALFGSPSWHRRRVADAVLPTPLAG